MELGNSIYACASVQENLKSADLEPDPNPPAMLVTRTARTSGPSGNTPVGLAPDATTRLAPPPPRTELEISLTSSRGTVDAPAPKPPASPA